MLDISENFGGVVSGFGSVHPVSRPETGSRAFGAVSHARPFSKEPEETGISIIMRKERMRGGGGDEHHRDIGCSYRLV